MRRVPVWALDDEKIAEFIRIRFPKVNTDANQRRLAARMVRFIYLYYREGSTAAQTGEALKMTVNAVDLLSRRIGKAMNRPLKPSHRPRKGDGIGASSGSIGEDHSSL
jgi:hypothetical protein